MKGHVPDENLFKYRILMGLSRRFKSLGDTIGPNDMEDSTICWRLASKYRAKAQELRVDIGVIGNKMEEKKDES
ncbi:hypothetical protein SEA_LEWANDO_84 [Arthrobacter phage Lewando]|nr:hypothetical protein SEA_LEWANDO_84 [Arthrobacter phage Lewando]